MDQDNGPTAITRKSQRATPSTMGVMFPMKCTENQRALVDASKPIAISKSTDFATKNNHQRHRAARVTGARPRPPSEWRAYTIHTAQVTVSSRNNRYISIERRMSARAEVTERNDTGRIYPAFSLRSLRSASTWASLAPLFMWPTAPIRSTKLL